MRTLDRYDYKEAILRELRGTTSIFFQMKIKDVLFKYYNYLEKTFEMPSPYGGDDKNDGWVVEDAIFYQIFAPTQIKASFSREVRSKFKEDLEGLLEKLGNGKWNGEINEFIFIVNTIDMPLPKDSDRFFDNTAKKLMEKYKINFNYRVSNLDYIDEILMKISNIEVLKDISSTLKVKNTIPVDSITEKMLLDTIEKIGSNLNMKTLGTLSFGDYEKISTTNKIYINDLTKKKQEINLLMNNLDVVERAVHLINQDIRFSNIFERVVSLIITKYNLLSKKYKGIDLLENLYKEVQKHSPGIGFTDVPTKLLVIYVFDKCDIFEKEEGEGYDTTK